jgi:hypothetical protein
MAYAPGDEFPKSVNLDDPSVTLVPADVLATAISKIFLLPEMMIYVRLCLEYSSSFLHKD